MFKKKNDVWHLKRTHAWHGELLVIPGVKP